MLVLENPLLQINPLARCNMIYYTKEKFSNFLLNLKHVNTAMKCDHSPTFTDHFRKLTCLFQTAHKCWTHFISDIVTTKWTDPKATVFRVSIVNYLGFKEYVHTTAACFACLLHFHRFTCYITYVNILLLNWSGILYDVFIQNITKGIPD